MDEASVPLADLIRYLDELLDAESFSDYGPNGLQVEGRNPVRKIVTSVSACLELFERAAKLGADAILVHHGIFWTGLPLQVTGLRYRRLETLVRNRISLIGYHLPLDAHPEFGNNALGARALGCEDIEPFAELEGRKIGFRGRLDEKILCEELVARCARVFGAEPIAFLGGREEIQTLGIVSGAGSKALYDAIDLGLDAFITGEPNEWVMNVAHEAGIHFLAAGHYRTEQLGVKALGDHLARQFGLGVEFVDVPNPV